MEKNLIQGDTIQFEIAFSKNKNQFVKNLEYKLLNVIINDLMKRNNGFIPGIKPGSETSDFISNVMDRITLPGSILLAVVAILPAFAMMFGVSQGFAQFYGGTSLLILVGVVLDTLQQIESHLLMRHYDGLMDSGRIKGKSSGSMVA